VISRVSRGRNSGPERVRELDGLRAIAVLPVIALHFGAAIDGGAGVTVFFALSGYIMTTLLIGEHGRRGAIDLRGFYVRRFRRLLPAATMVVAATVIIGRLLGKPSLFRDAIASLTYWANFARYSSHYSYGQTAYAPLEHFWSLAIEEQFYVVLPILCVFLLPLGRRVLAGVAATGMLASAVFAFANRDDPQMYFHTLARVGELLAGVVLAVVLPPLVRWGGGVGRRVATIAGYAGLVGLIVVFARVVEPQPIFVALLACLVIAGRPRILGFGPLVVIGTYSYGLYLWHPLAELLSDRLVVRISITIVVTLLSFHIVEFPVRRTLTVARAVSVMGALSVAALLAVVVAQRPTHVRFLSAAPVVAAASPDTDPAITAFQSTATTTAATAAATAASAAAATSLTTPASDPSTIAKPRALRISAAGDSTQMFADAAWQAFAKAYPETVTWVTPPAEFVPWTSGADGWGGEEAAKLGLSLAHDGPQGGLDRQGCPMLYDLPIRAVEAFDFEDPAKLHSASPISSCDWHEWIPASLAQMHLDVLVVSWAVTDMWEYKLADGRHASVGDPDFDALLNERMAEFEAMAATYGTRVVWTTYQPISGDDNPAPWTRPETADALAAVMLQRPCVSDLRSLVRSDPAFDWYQDGYHFSPAGAARAVAATIPDIVACAHRAS
jgi:peptidoglycan/LPS O-acetylase OafA/YrhL